MSKTHSLIWRMICLVLLLSVVAWTGGTVALAKTFVSLASSDWTNKGPSGIIHNDNGIPVKSNEFAPGDTPRYGGQLNLLYNGSDILGFDEGYLAPWYCVTNHLTEDEMLIGDWTQGPAGTNRWTWTTDGIYNWSSKAGSLCDTWQVITPYHWTFHVRQDVHFSLDSTNEASTLVNGRLVTANDIVYSYLRLCTLPDSYIYLAHPYFTRNVQMIATNQANIDLVVPNDPDSIYQIAQSLVDWNGTIAKEVIDTWGDMKDWKHAHGTGPFILKDFVSGSSATFVKNPDYWGKDPIGPGMGNQLPYVDGVKIFIITDVSTQLAALRTGKIDMVSGVGIADTNSVISTSPYIQTLELPATLNIYQIYMRTDKTNMPYHDQRVRQAMLKATDYSTIINTLYGGKGVYPTFPCPPVLDIAENVLSLQDASAEARDLYNYNANVAKALLAEAGYPDGFTTTILAPNDTTSIAYLSVIRDQWAKVNITLNITQLEYGVYLNRWVSRDYPELFYGIMTSPGTFRTMVSSQGSGGGYNLSYIVDDRLAQGETQMIAAFNSGDDTEVARIHKQLCGIIYEEAYAISTPAQPSYVLWQPWLENYHGEQALGIVNGLMWSKYIWIDQDVKQQVTGNTSPQLSSGAVNPTSGYNTTSFTYSINYLDVENNPPSTMTVTIDGTTHAMTLKPGGDGNYVNGETFQYTIGSLAKGENHTYRFNASDGTTSATGNTGVHNGPDVVNSLPVANAGLDRPSVINRLFTLNGSASDADGDSLTYSWMQTTGPNVSLSDNTTATPRFTPTISDNYTFSLVVNDGIVDSQPDTVVISVRESNAPPVLSSGAVTPTSGLTSNTFIYSVTYSDNNDDAPAFMTVSIDSGTPQAMIAGSGNYTAGMNYQYSNTLGAGNHNFLFAASDGMDSATGDINTHNGPNVSSPVTDGGGFGGGGGSGGGGTVSGPGVTSLSPYVSFDGHFNLAASVKSEDGKINIDIAKGVLAQTKDAIALKSIKIVPFDNPANPPSNSKFVGSVYEFTPEGATFSPAITFTIFYDPSTIPEDIDLNTLTVMVFNTATSSWESLPSTLNKANSSVSASIAHFSIYALVGKKVAPPTTQPAPAPAKFTLSDLIVNPVSVSPGQTITISTKVSNTGGTSGEYEIALKVNGTVESTKKVTVDSGASSIVTFTVTKSSPGDYSVDVNGATASFTIQQIQITTTPPPQTQVPTTQSNPGGANWLVIVLIIASVVIVGGGAAVILTRKRK
jgi:peptide/nickel transport system substrate-binding protein